MAKIKEEVMDTAPSWSPSVERQGASKVAVSYRLPRVIGGLCEACGVIDRNQPAEVQYRLCPHYKNIGALRCSYCDETVDPEAIIGHHKLNVATHPDNANKLVVWCGSYKCSLAHEKRFSHK